MSSATTDNGKEPAIKSERRSSVPNDEDPDESSSVSKKPVVKKRTKTGCLTCRRRRIKCDEGKPRCSNCIKSKRQCDGYNQRVIFKDPMGTFQSNHMAPIVFQSNSGQQLLGHASAPSSSKPSSQGPLPFIAPKPVNEVSPTHTQLPHNLQQVPHHPNVYPAHQYHHYQEASPSSAHPLSAGASFNPPIDSTAQFMPPWQSSPVVVYPPSIDQAELISSATFDTATIPVLHSTQPQQPAHPPQLQQPQQPQLPQTILDMKQAAFHDHNRDAGQSSGYTVFTEEDAYWYSDDDASMAESDDDEALEQESKHLESNDLGVIVAKKLQNEKFDSLGTQMRTFSNFADANVLATYIPSSINSPLNDAQTAAVFWYFVNVTGPSMSLFERHPLDPSPMFQGQPVPRARQHIWTYVFPIIALNHPALLQAMLALGSLQMAKLQGVPPTASMKHYHLSLRRLARNYQSVSRRVQPATLAATMLLSFYEVWNSDHDKWCKHMWGARAILKEIPVRDMTRSILALKRAQRLTLETGGYGNEPSSFAYPNLGERDIDHVDSNLVAQLSGQPVGYEESFDEHRANSVPSPSWTTPSYYTEKDIETFEHISDLFWWYCKMDVYQSILGATPLLMEYECKTQCAPRAPIGKIDAIYGTHDHLMILLSRLCNFSSRDQVRKRKTKRPEPPGGNNDQGHSPPPFAGMMPTTGKVTVPTGFSPPRQETPTSDNSEEIDIDESTAAAMQEWESIRQTFDLFREQLGPDFDPLGPEYEPPVSSPFGLTLKYRTYGIAGIWMNYYMGLIILHRSHPSMPPVAMASAGLAARQTAPYANEIGRIVAGLTYEDLSTLTHVSTLLGAISIESSFPLFVAAVQYQDTAQRHWTVRQMHNVSRLTGWQSARQIANGCETGWTKAAKMGRGPPYSPPTELTNTPASILTNPRRIIDRIREVDEDDGKVVLSSSERPHYAIGILSVEADLEKLELRDD